MDGIANAVPSVGWRPPVKMSVAGGDKGESLDVEQNEQQRKFFSLRFRCGNPCAA